MSRRARNRDQGRAATGDRAAGWRRPELGSQLWPVLYLKARGPAKRTGGSRVTHLAETLGDRFLRYRDDRQTLPAFAAAPPPGPGTPPRSASTWQPQPRPTGLRASGSEASPRPPQGATRRGTSGSDGWRCGGRQSGRGTRFRASRAFVERGVRSCRARTASMRWPELCDRVLMDVPVWPKSGGGSQERHVALVLRWQQPL